MGAPPPVGPWRWVILLVRMGVCFVSYGVFKSMGVFIDEFVEYFECTTRAAGLTVSLTFTIGNIAGIFSGVLLRILGARLLMILSGAVFAISLIAAVVSQSLVHIAPFFIVCSFGYSMTRIASVAALLQYFPDSFASVNGIGLAGSPLGMMIFPPVVQQLIQLYGWRGALAILGAMSANYCVFATLVRPLRARHTYKTIPLADGVPRSTTDQPPNESLCWDNCKITLGTLFEKIDLQIFVDEPGFVTTQIVNFLEGMLFFGWHIYLVPNGVALGFSETKSSFLATFGGLGTMFGRLSSSYFIDRELFQTQHLFAGSAFLLALMCLLDPIASPSYEAIASLAVLAGLCFGVLFPLMFVHSVTEERRVSATAWMFLVRGFGMSAGGFLFGWIYDVTGDYGVAFCSMGVLSAVMGALSLTLRPACFSCKTRDRSTI